MSSINTDGSKLIPITARNGNTFAISAVFTNDDATPLSLIGATIVFNVKQSSLSQDLSSDINITGGGNNVLNLSSFITLPKGLYNYTLTIKFSTGATITFFYGPFTVNGI